MPQMSAMRLFAVALVLSILPSACVTIPSDFKQPGVTLKSISPRVSTGLTPEFDIVLQVTNPNRAALAVEGMSYTLLLRGKQVMDGVAGDIPEIAAYGEAEVAVHARADLFGGIALLADLLDSPGEPVDFEFRADIDIGSIYPMIRLRKSGSLFLP